LEKSPNGFRKSSRVFGKLPNDFSKSLDHFGKFPYIFMKFSENFGKLYDLLDGLLDEKAFPPWNWVKFTH
jgi:hypothetical protein